MADKDQDIGRPLARAEPDLAGEHHRIGEVSNRRRLDAGEGEVGRRRDQHEVAPSEGDRLVA